MPLAATLAAGGLRPASFLPAIKCSDCGHEIEIAAMGDHECSARAPAETVMDQAEPYSHEEWPTIQYNTWQEPWSAAPPVTEPQVLPQPDIPSNPYALQSLNPFAMHDDSSPFSLSHDDEQHSPAKSAASIEDAETHPSMLSPLEARMPRQLHRNLPNIDPRAANQAGFDSDASRSDSPLSPAPSARSRSRHGARPPPSPRPRLYDPRPPSTEISANMDCAFPPFPISKPTRQNTTSGRKTPSEKFPARTSSKYGGRPKADQTVESQLPPSIGEGMMPSERANSLSVNGHDEYGIHDGRAATESSWGQPASPHGEDRSTSPWKANLPVPDVGRRPSSPALSGTRHILSGNQHSLNRSGTQDTTKGFSPSRSAPTRDPSSQDSNYAASLVPEMGAIGNFDFREHRSTSPEQQYIKSDVSHGTSYSNSSTSSQHFDSNSSAHTYPSPNTSMSGSVDTFPSFSYMNAKHEDDESYRSTGLSVVHEQPGMQVEQSQWRSPPRTFARPAQAPPSLDMDNLESAPPRRGEFTDPVESPMDPALRGNTLAVESEFPFKVEPRTSQNITNASPPPNARLHQAIDAPALPPEPPVESHAPFPVRGSSLRHPGRHRSKSSAQVSVRPLLSRDKSNMDQSSRPSRAPASTTVSNELPHNPPHVRRPAGKAICRGCGLAIEGKSVKAADGRLTGRWHKACFTCRTCEQPFTTADFYVLNNHPYCEQHYHERNGSLCHGCHRGIEGQYLEATSSGRHGDSDRKYHPRCFTCVECRQVLMEDYFEISGRVYCERHAQSTMRAQSRQGGRPNGLFPQDRRGLYAERRTTRLMMMG